MTVVTLEIVLQIAFVHLPQSMIEQMPQYQERIGMRLTTEHGVREYPAGKQESFEVTSEFGDLYQLTCLSEDDAAPFVPYTVSYVRDSHGFRNDEPWPDDVDLVVIGDSFTAAEAIVRPFWEGLSDSMLVFGLPGSGTLEHQRLFEAFALPRHPETVVLAFFAGNDLNDSKVFSDNLSEGLTFADRVHGDKNPLDYSVLFHLLLYVRRSSEPEKQALCHYPQIAETEPRTPVAFYKAFLPNLAKDGEAIRNSEAFRLAWAGISEMAEAQHSRGAAFVLMYIPQKAELYWPYLNAQSKAEIIAGVQTDRRFTGLEGIEGNLSAQRDVLQQMASAIGIPFLDLTPVLQEAIDDGLSPWFVSDTHWNQVGHNIARIALLDFLN